LSTTGCWEQCTSNVAASGLWKQEGSKTGCREANGQLLSSLSAQPACQGDVSCMERPMRRAGGARQATDGSNTRAKVQGRCGEGAWCAAVRQRAGSKQTGPRAQVGGCATGPGPRKGGCVPRQAGVQSNEPGREQVGSRQGRGPGRGVQSKAKRPRKGGGVPRAGEGAKRGAGREPGGEGETPAPRGRAATAAALPGEPRRRANAAQLHRGPASRGGSGAMEPGISQGE